jgi:Protein of unknown function (DUF3037)
MKTYQYQLLRYTHDLVTGEFVNVGVVVFEPQTGFLKSKMIAKFGRITQFYSEVNGHAILHSLKAFEAGIKRIARQLHELFRNDFKTIDEITNEILPKNDSALQCTEVSYALDTNLDDALEDLFERLVDRYNQEIVSDTLDDKEVWKSVYKQHFDKYGVTAHLKHYSIATQNDIFEFDKAWRNGVWNCYQSLSLDLKNTSSIKDKVYKWVGKLNELETASERINVYFLTVYPEKESLQRFIKDTLSNSSFHDYLSVSIINENEAESFAKKVQTEIAGHLSENKM